MNEESKPLSPLAKLGALAQLAEYKCPKCDWGFQVYAKHFRVPPHTQGIQATDIVTKSGARVKITAELQCPWSGAEVVVQ